MPRGRDPILTFPPTVTALESISFAPPWRPLSSLTFLHYTIADAGQVEAEVWHERGISNPHLEAFRNPPRLMTRIQNHLSQPQSHKIKMGTWIWWNVYWLDVHLFKREVVLFRYFEWGRRQYNKEYWHESLCNDETSLWFMCSLTHLYHLDSN